VMGGHGTHEVIRADHDRNNTENGEPRDVNVMVHAGVPSTTLTAVASVLATAGAQVKGVGLLAPILTVCPSGSVAVATTLAVPAAAYSAV
jgi:hypothetical protein